MKEHADSEYLFGDANDMYRPFVNHLRDLGLGDKAFPHVMRHSRATHLPACLESSAPTGLAAAAWPTAGSGKLPDDLTQLAGLRPD